MTSDRADATAIAQAVRAGRVSATEVVGAALARIDAIDGRIGAFREVHGEEALRRAGAIDARIAAGSDPGPLAGVPVALKDNLCAETGTTACCSRILEGYRSPFTATAVARLLDAGAVPVGRTRMDEFAMGSSGERSAAGGTANPWALDRVPGGSSSGSAAAVAAGMVPLALGSDTGGSIRQPAGFTGTVGLKPTYGRVSRYGLVAFASSLDQIGPIARSTRDAALALAALAGHDPLDATSARSVLALAGGIDVDAAPAALRVGVPRQTREDPVHAAVRAALERASEVLAGSGAELVDVDLPQLDTAIAAYYVVAPAEAASNLARYDGVRYGRRAELAPGEGLAELYARSRGEGFGPEVRRRIILGTFVLSSGYHEAYYMTALRARRLVHASFAAIFAGGCHAILLPTTPGPAFPIGAKLDDPLAMYLEDRYTVAANLAGLPAISIPAGATVDAPNPLPVGVQLVGAAFDEPRLLAIARTIERALDHEGQIAPDPA